MITEHSKRQGNSISEVRRERVSGVEKRFRRRLQIYVVALLGAGVLSLAASPGAAQGTGQLSNLGMGGFRLDGVAAGDLSGRSVSGAGDVNGDGFDDVIIGAYLADSNGFFNAGESYVVFGKPSGVNTAVKLSALTGADGFRLAGTHQSGLSVSGAGDVNGDGFADVIVGAPHATINGINSGASYVVFGKASGFASSINLADLNGTDGFRLVGAATGDWAGVSVSGAGDVNGDGFADVIVGARYADPNGSSNAGASYLVFGKASGFNPSTNLSELSAADGFRLVGATAGEQSGISVSGAGDINGDGLADLIIGASRAQLNGSNSGATYVIFGKDLPFDSSINLSDLDGANGFRLVGAAAGDQAGCSVSEAGDINGDGFDDLSIGAYSADPNNIFDSGESYVVFGKASPFDASINLSDFSGENGFRLTGAAQGDESGFSVSGAGDVNGDGFSDLIIGANRAQPNGSISGMSYVLFGKASGFASPISVSTLSGSTGLRLAGVAAGDLSGRSVSGAGDVNGDGFADVIVGAMGADTNGMDSGASYVVFGGNGPSATYRGRTVSGNSPKTPVGATADGNAPSSRMWLDFDGGTQSSLERVTLTREAREDLRNLEPTEDGSRTVWDVHSNREGWTNCTVTLRYTDAEIAGVSGGEAGLTIFRAPTPAGPWTPLTNSTVDTTRNQISASTNRLAFFTVASSSVPVTLTEWELE